MKHILVIAATTLLAAASFANEGGGWPMPGDSTGGGTVVATGAIYAPNYTCSDLRTMVANAAGPVGIQGRFGYAAYASTRAKCGADMLTGKGIVWGTADKKKCNVGYVCVANHNSDGGGSSDGGGEGGGGAGGGGSEGGGGEGGGGL